MLSEMTPEIKGLILGGLASIPVLLPVLVGHLMNKTVESRPFAESVHEQQFTPIHFDVSPEGLPITALQARVTRVRAQNPYRRSMSLVALDNRGNFIV